MINEAIYTLYEGVGNVEAIDTAMRLGAHHPMGPLELADFIGLDTCLSVMQVLHEGLAEFEIPAVPPVGEIRRSRLARAQDPARLLRLSRRKAGADQVVALRKRPSPGRERDAAAQRFVITTSRYSDGTTIPLSAALFMRVIRASRSLRSAACFGASRAANAFSIGP